MIVVLVQAQDITIMMKALTKLSDLDLRPLRAENRKLHPQAPYLKLLGLLIRGNPGVESSGNVEA